MYTSSNGSEGENETRVERRSDRELVIKRSFNAPPHLVFKAWTTPDLLKRWWAPKSTGLVLVNCEVDARTNGTYRFEFSHAGSETFAFFGRYTEVIQDKRLSWTNEESEEGALTTVTFEDVNGKTELVHTELYPSKEALDDAFIGMEGGMPEQFVQLDAVLVGASGGAA